MNTKRTATLTLILVALSIAVVVLVLATTVPVAQISAQSITILDVPDGSTIGGVRNNSEIWSPGQEISPPIRS